MTYFHPDTDFFVKNNLTPPSVDAHGIDEDIRSKLKPLKLYGWKQEGNLLIAQSDMGEVVNTIPADVQLQGVDEQGNPILAKVKF